MSVPLIGESYRGVEGHSGYLLRQAWQQFAGASEGALRAHGLTGAQFGALSVLARQGPLSGADLARACNTTPQAVNGVLASLEREGFVERRRHPTHGRIREVVLTEAGQGKLDAATPSVRALEVAMEEGFDEGQVAAVKTWLVEAAQRLAGQS